jgi:putative ABC transport system permease protein
MISIALRNLFGEKTRFAISIGGVAFSVMLILTIVSLFRGWQIRSTQYIREIDTDIYVTQNGSSDITSSASIIPISIKDQIEEIEAVTEVNRFIGRPLQFKIKDRDVNAYLVGYDTKKKIAGPTNIIKGKAEPGTDEIVLDKVLMTNNNLSLGDFIEIFDRPFKIVGVAEGANMFVFQFSFINQEEALDVFKMEELATFLLVKTEKDKVHSVIDEINKIEGLEAMTRNEFVERNKKILNEVFIPIISVLVIISILVGTAVIGLTIYTATVEKAKEFGVLKALGASNMQIYRIIFEQSLVSGVVGYIVGIAATYFILWLIPIYVPVFVTVTLVEDLVWIFGVSIFMSVLASYTPVRRIVKIDPALVFNSAR